MVAKTKLAEMSFNAAFSASSHTNISASPTILVDVKTEDDSTPSF